MQEKFLCQSFKRFKLSIVLTVLLFASLVFSNSPAIAANGIAESKKPLVATCVKAKLSKGFRYCDTDGGFYVEYYIKGKIAGQVHTGLSKDPTKNKILFIEFYQTAPEHRNKGISGRLFKKLLELAGPHVEQIHAYMAHKNLESLIDEKKRLDSVKDDYTLYAFNKLAARGTYFARAWAELGFSEVLEFDSDPSASKLIILGKQGDCSFRLRQ